MLGSVVLDVAIGMAFVYLLLSLIASVMQEILAAFMQLRGANLQRGLNSLFSGDRFGAGLDLVDTVYNHGLIRGLYSDPAVDDKQDQFGETAAGLKARRGVLSRALNAVRFGMRYVIGIRPYKDVTGVADQILLPSYIPSRTFSLAMIDILNRNKAMGDEAMGAITQDLAQHHWLYRNNRAGEALLALAVDAKGDLKVFQQNVENWYNDAMDRASGWYKRYTQKILIVIGLILAIVFNVDSVRVARTLWTDRDARQVMVDAAGEYGKTHPDGLSKAHVAGAGTAGPSVEDFKDRLRTSAEAFSNVTKESLLPVGWKYSWSGYREHLEDDPGGVAWSALRLLVGWGLTAIAVSLGAPFWFDTLNKFMVVRSTIKPREKSKEEGSKD